MSLKIPDCDNLQLEQLQQCLRDTLKNQKYLLVLDDVWNENHAKWVELINLLTGGADGSKIIVTTRNQSVASIVGTTDHKVEVQGMSHDESLSLFIKWAFKSNQDACRHPHLVEISESIVEKCKGVPLAVRTLGSMLYTKTEECEWINVRDNEIWNIEQKEGDIMAVLKLSYSQLPTNLRRCFAFCSLFPKDYRFISLGLTMYWQANGLLQRLNNSRDAEGVGTMYIKKLLSRGFFQEFEDYGSLKTFKMHDLVHDLALLVAEHDCIHLNSQEVGDCFSTRLVRHISFPRNYICTKKISNWLMEQKGNVHTFAFPEGMGASKASYIEACISKFKSLRILDLRESSFEVLPTSIGNLKHLKNLDVSENNQFQALPASICQLVGLEALDFTGCLNIEKLPRGLGQLIRLRSLGITTKQTYLPDDEIRCLTSLKTLSIVDCPNLNNCVSDDAMQCLSTIRLLSIEKCESLVSLPTKGLRSLTRLETLSISECRYLNFTTYNHCDISETPKVGEEEGLRSIRMLSVWGLPKLEILPLWLVHGANNLKFLGVGGCENLTNLMPEPLFERLKSLQRLAIRSCPKLAFLPETMCHLTALDDIQIADCPELVSRCQKDDEDWHKMSYP